MPPSGGTRSGFLLALSAFLDDHRLRRAGQFTGQPVNLASKPRRASPPRTIDQAHCPRWTLKSVSAPPPAARSSCPSCRVGRGRMRGEGKDGWGVGLVEDCWLRSFRYPSPQTVADKADGTGRKERQRARLGRRSDRGRTETERRMRDGSGSDRN